MEDQDKDGITENAFNEIRNMKLICHIEDIITKLKRRWIKLRLQPISVFVFHQVSDTFDKTIMWDCDWNGIDSFKKRILKLKKEYSFISLQDAHRHISEDYIRTKKYAVLTADDGFLSIKNILPWLAEQQIPVTLFLNPGYLTGDERPGKGVDSILSKKEIEAILEQCKPYITIASHGWTHKFCTEMSNEEFVLGVNKSDAYFQNVQEYIPFYAYPCGRHKEFQDRYLLEHNIVPVYCDGGINYNDGKRIHRECIDEGYSKEL